ncbi:MAG: flagellar brake protein [Betaproteobacteria bacterium]|nr:flagellar brake protein [Betaproteobacteria bacterium]
MPNSTVVADQAKTVSTADTDYHQYAVGSRLEISQILHAIMRQAALITASIGDDFFLTSIVQIDDAAGCLMLECERNGRFADRILSRQRLLCSTTLEKIKIQFVCEDIALATCEGRDAFRIALPQDLLRLQRREYFRMATPVTVPVKCTMTVPHNDGNTNVQLSLVDISCGGIAMLTPPELFTPALGAVYDCGIHLPGTAVLRTRVQARNAFMMNLANGKSVQRSGFAYVDLRESMLSIVQRYILALERQRKK